MSEVHEQSDQSAGKRKFFIIAALVLALDQLSKLWAHATLRVGQDISLIPGLLRLTYTENSGIAFGLFGDTGARWVLVSISVVAISIVIYYLSRTPTGNRLLLWSLSLMAAGITGNLVDRIRRGQVIDFILAYYKDHEWPVFNVADTAISIGAALMAIELFVSSHRENTKSDAETDLPLADAPSGVQSEEP